MGGDTSNIEHNPWLAQIHVHGEFYCGASIISAEFILTAAHCVPSLDPQAYKVAVGLSNMHDSRIKDHRDNFPLREVDQVYVHPDYIDHPRYGSPNDIALLKLKSPLELDESLPAICLPDPDETAESFESQVCKLAGWGATEYNKFTSIVRQLDSFVINETRCTAYLTNSVDYWGRRYNLNIYGNCREDLWCEY